jgi:Domain of unknown function (DUF4365)
MNNKESCPNTRLAVPDRQERCLARTWCHKAPHRTRCRSRSWSRRPTRACRPTRATSALREKDPSWVFDPLSQGPGRGRQSLSSGFRPRMAALVWLPGTHSALSSGQCAGGSKGSRYYPHVSHSAASAASPEVVLRGSPQRKTDFMEQLQVGFLRAVAASAGCVPSEPVIDEGIDVILSHKSISHTYPGDNCARLEVQLKATAEFVDSDGDHVSVPLQRDRWDYYRADCNTLSKIVVILSMPSDQADWTLADHDVFSIYHCAYWVNLATEPQSTLVKPLAVAPRSQIFDDIALCKIMARIGKGGRP